MKSSENLDKIFKFGLSLIEEAEQHIKKNYNKIARIDHKNGHFNLVTNVDKEVEEIIVRKIKSNFSDHVIIAEESGRHNKHSMYEWFIDPIDGTTNFAHGYPFFCTSIGFAIDDEMVIGLVNNPIRNELFTGRKNKGAYLNKKKIRVSSIKKLQDALLVTGFPHDKKSSKMKNFNRFKNLTLNSHGVRRDGAAALDLCYVACGRVDAFWEEKLSSWDVAAGKVILEEAGGKITKFSGEKYSVFDKEIIASNGKIHSEMLKWLK